MKRFLISCALLMAAAGCGDCTGHCDQTVPFPQPGACPQPGKNAGEVGGPCPSSIWDACVDSECIDGTCLPCGGVDEKCCGNDETCNAGLTCNPMDGWNTCTDKCGQLGQQCCNLDTCGSGLACDVNSKTCQAMTTSACQGSIQFFVGLKNTITFCGGNFLSVMADTPEQAASCAQAVLAQQGLTGLVEPQTPSLLPNAGDEFTYCSTSFIDPKGSSVTVQAFSKSDADVCVKQYCSVDCSFTDGECK